MVKLNCSPHCVRTCASCCAAAATAVACVGGQDFLSLAGGDAHDLHRSLDNIALAALASVACAPAWSTSWREMASRGMKWLKRTSGSGRTSKVSTWTRPPGSVGCYALGLRKAQGRGWARLRRATPGRGVSRRMPRRLREARMRPAVEVETRQSEKVTLWYNMR